MRAVVAVLELLERDRQKSAAVRVVIVAARMKAAQKPQWWAWTVWLAAGLSCVRISRA